MKCVRVTDPVDAFCLINRIEQKCDIVDVYGSGHSREEIYDLFMYESRMYKFMSDRYDKVFAVAILEEVEEGKANIHFSMFTPCHILRGYCLLMEQICNVYNELMAYIEPNRQDIVKLLRMIGFNVKKLDNGYYYGQSKKSGVGWFKA